MKDIIIFTAGAKAYAPSRIREEAEKIGLRIELIHYRDISINVSSKVLEILYHHKPLPRAKGIFIRGLGEDSIYNPLKTYLIGWYLRSGSKVFNSDSFSRWPSLDKTTQYLELFKADSPIIESFIFGSKEELFKWSQDKNNFPFIAKDNTGSCGFDVYKIENKRQLVKLIGSGYTLKTIKSLIFQRFLKAGEDLRVIILGGEALGAMKRIAQKGKYLTNYSQGGKVVAYDIGKDSEAGNLAKKVAKHFLLDYGGIDLMRDGSGKWVVLEVNRACQFEGFEKATKVNIAKKIVEYLAK